jgi:FKBP-type peptidyl-prolyl cis-trans isomerase
LKRLALILAFASLAACGGDGTTTPTGPTTLQIEDLAPGTGATAAVGDLVSVFYTGAFLDGRVFDTNVGGTAFSFQIGARQVIAGFEQGIVGMRVGGRRRITIPPSLAYGSTGSGPIPPNTPIRFDVDLVAVAGK